MGIQTHNISLNNIYFFSFKSDIAQLNGIYRVQAILQPEEVQVILDDPIQVIYQAVNKLDLYDTDLLESKYRNEVFYKLQTVDGEKVFYFPDSLIVEYPVSNYKVMMDYMVTLQIGIIDNPDELEALSVELCKVTKRGIGITPVISIATYGKQYLTTEAIDQHTHARNIYRSNDPVIEQIFLLEKENAKLRKQNAKYERIIIDYEQQKKALTDLKVNP